jgi:superfamily II RNA helicase
MKYKEFTLDQFQEDAIAAIERDHSVVVSAATGTGKTLIADYVINKAIGTGERVVYTAPIKALSNQKFRDFKAEYGDKVGMLTGDIVINPSAQILIMTTEIYRNMLLEHSDDLAEVKYVVFDEIHFINDIERGTVWEESIIFSPDQVRFVCLSATIPNYEQFGDWISEIKHHPVEKVNYMQRAVPLTHKVFDTKLGITTIENLQKDSHKNEFAEIKPHRHKRNSRRDRFEKKSKLALPSHIDLVKNLESMDKLPAIFFSFSRMLCERRAKELAKKNTFVNDDQRKTIVEAIHDIIPSNIRTMHSAREIKQVLVKGIGVHHAGMLPKVKEAVEHLFNKGLLKVLYATETFAVGINMPAKCVCFGSLEKYDGLSFRLLNTKEYFQLAGRAGRRGIDTEGLAVSVIDRNRPELYLKIQRLMKGDTEPIKSQYNLSYNTVLNLIKFHDDENIERILRSNFGYYVKKQNQNQTRIMQSYANYCTILNRLGFLEDKQLTWKGDFASRIYTKELEVGELVFQGMLEQLSLKHMCVLLAALIYEPRRMDKFDIRKANVDKILDMLAQSSFLNRKIKKLYLKRMYRIVSAWVEGAEFEDLLKLSSLAEGDVIRLFRQLIDMLRQIKGSLLATEPNHPLIDKLNEALTRIDRDIVSIEL